MKFSTAKNIALAFLLASMGIGLIGAFTLDQQSSQYTFSVVATLAFFVIAIGVILIWCRCPKCGKRIVYQLYKYKKCPKCGAPLNVDKKSSRPSKNQITLKNR